MAYVTGGKADKVLAATQKALKRVGITVNPLAGDAGVVLLDVHRVAEQHHQRRSIGMAQAGMGPGLPDPARLLPERSRPRCAIKPSGTSNYASLERPEGRRR